MRLLSRMTSFLRNIFGKRNNDRELDDEIRGYADLIAEEKMHQGMKPEEARREARMELGGIEQVKENVREVRAGAWLDSLLQDIRYGLRMLRKNPGFTAIAVLTLALGIGANTAIFTLTYAVILKSLPVPNPQQLVRYSFRNGETDIGLSGPVFDALRKQETTNQDLLAWSASDFPLQESGSFTNVKGALVSGNGFRVLELKPLLGRFFTETDDVPGGGPNGYQAMVGYEYWKKHFRASPDVIGQSLSIDGKAVTVMGVLPAGFDGLVSGERADILLPLAFEEVLNAPTPRRHHPGSFWLTVIGRLKPGESIHTATANLQATETAVRAEADPSQRYLSGFFAPFRISIESGRSGSSLLKTIYTRPLIVLEILVGLLLLLCCANTALLVLARVSSRLREFAVRSALGAPRRRLLRQVLTEIALLACCGLAAGIVLGWVAAKSLVSMLAGIGQPPPLSVTPQVAILAFTAAVTIFSALTAGIWPALRASRVSPILGMKQSATSSYSKSLGGWIVPAQVAVSVTLLAAASLLGSSFLHLLLADSGFQTDGLVMADVDLSANKPTEVASTQYAQQVAEALGQMSGIQAAAAMSLPPLYGWYSAAHYFSVRQQGVVHTDMNLWAETVTPGYFAAMGTPILEGRPFTRADLNGEPLCILSASAARYFFPNEDALGRYVYAGATDESLDGKTKTGPNETFRVIGVSAEARFRSLQEEAPRTMYQLPRRDEIRSDFFIIARGDSARVTSDSIREAVRRVVPSAAPPTVFPFTQLVTTHLRKERMLMALSACFAGIAMLLTLMGLYGLLARSVVVRTKEIGLRLALGAHPRDVLVLILRQGLRLIAIGTIVGLAAVFGLTHLLKTLLFGISATNPLLLAIVISLLFGLALATSCIPAWRAARIDPMEALRHE